MSIEISEEIQSFWNSFIEGHGDLSYLKDFKFEAWSFGNTPEMADELGKLVVEGKKTATCSLLRAYRGYENEIPSVGVYSIVCDGKNNPLCVVVNTDVWLDRFDKITAWHAYEEGEGDRSLAYWQKVHKEFFSQYDGFHEKDDLVCERFKVVYKA